MRNLILEFIFILNYYIILPGVRTFFLFSPSPHSHFFYLCGNMKRDDLIEIYLQMKHFTRKYILEFQIANQCVRRKKQERCYIYGDLPVSGETILEL